MFRNVLGAVALVTLMVAGNHASAQSAGAESQTIKMQLNRLVDVDAACRAYFELVNPSDTTFTSYTVDLVFYDTADIIQRRALVIFAPLLAQKTHVKIYDIKGQSCENVGRILLNDVSECKAEATVLDNCVQATDVRSLAGVDFFK